MRQAIFKIRKNNPLSAIKETPQSAKQDNQLESLDTTPFKRCEEKMMQLMNMFETILNKTNQSDRNFKKNGRYNHSQAIYNLQVRDKHPLIPIPILEQGKQLKKDELQDWITQLCTTVFSTSFNYFVSEKMTYEQVRIFCAQSVIQNLLILVQDHNLTSEQIRIIDEHMQKKILPYMEKKYPLTEETDVNKALQKVVEEINNLDLLSNDFFYNSGIMFTYQKSGNYNETIMKVINKVLEQVDSLSEIVQETLKEQSQQMSNFKDFQNTMSHIFQKTEDILWMNEKDGNSLSPLKKQLSLDNQRMIQKSMQKEKYRQKVRSYTHFAIGRKISENVELFTEKEIQSQHLTIKHPAILRILTKWCEQLWTKFKNPNYMAEKTEGIQVQQGGSVGILYDSFKTGIDNKLQQEKANILTYVKELQDNFYDQQALQLIKNMHKDDHNHIPKLQRAFGKHSEQTVKSLHTYIVLYLNRLIHGLITAGNGWYSTVNTGWYPQWKNPPNLTTFKIGDLIRCKCSSKQKEIIKIYKQLLNMSTNQPQKLKIVRIKNRLHSGTNDILINVKFNNLIIGQIQLAVNSKKSKFLSCSNSFSHYLYELQRSIFGPISQMCSIWKSLDNRNKQFERIIHKQSLKSITKQERNMKQTQKRCVKKQGHIFDNFELFFQCSYCNVPYYHNNYIISNKKCKHCIVYKCVRCQIQSYESNKLKKLIFTPQIYKQNKEAQFRSSMPQTGICIHIESKHPKPQFYKKFTFNGVDSYLGKKPNGQIYRVLNPPSGKLDQFQKEYCFFTIPYENQVFQNFSNQIVNKQFIIPFYLKESFKQEKQTLSLSQKRFVLQQWKKMLDCNGEFERQKKKIKKIYFSENYVNEGDFIFDLFPNLTYLNLQYNYVKTFTNIGKLSKLQVLSLQNNQIATIPPQFCQLQSLVDLNLFKNQISILPQQFGNLKKLQILNVKQNQLESLPDSIGQLQCLTDLLLSTNKLLNLPQSISNLKKLNLIAFNICNFTVFPQGLCLCQNLTQLDCSNNTISILPQNIGDMKQLKKIKMSNNAIQKLPERFGELQHLQELEMYQNKLKHLPENFGKLKKLEKLSLNQNVLQSLPENIGELQSLSNLQISNNVIKSLPESFGNMLNLTELIMQKCSLESLPKGFENLAKIEVLHLLQNNIKEIDVNLFGKMEKLRELNLNSNKLELFPHMSSCSALFQLNFGQNKIKLIEKEKLVGLDSLQKFNISKNELVSFPQAILQLKKIKELNMSGNQIQIIGNDTIQLHLQKQDFILPNLQLLDLSSNNFKEIPIQFFNKTKLTSLMLNNNKIIAIPKEIQSLINIKSLQLQGNEIEVVSPETNNLPNLKRLNLTKNKMKIVPIYLSVPKFIQDLYIEQNPLEEFESLDQVVEKSKGQIQSIARKMKKLQNIVQVPNLQNAVCMECNQKCHIPFYWLKWQEGDKFGCRKCIEKSSKVEGEYQSYNYSYKKNSVLLRSETWKVIPEVVLGKNLQPQNMEKLEIHSFSCNKCYRGALTIGEARYICTGCRNGDRFSRSEDYVDCCQSCMMKILDQELKQKLGQQNHKQQHPFLRILYNINGYYDF